MAFIPFCELLCFHLTKEKKTFALPYASACFLGFFNTCYATLPFKERCMIWSPLLVKIMRVEPPPQVILQWRLQRRTQTLRLTILKEKSLATLEQEKQPAGMYLLVFFCQKISCRRTRVAMLILQLGSFSIKAVYQVRKFHLLSSLKLLLGITGQERLVLLADCEETLFPLTELVTVSWFILTSRSPASSIPRHVQKEQVNNSYSSSPSCIKPLCYPSTPAAS